MDVSTLETKKALARALKGVSYDARRDKFVADIIVDGTRRYLGAFEKAEDAAAAYANERASHRVTRRTRRSDGTLGQTFVEAFKLFLTHCQRTAKGDAILPGEIFEAPGGQRFCLIGRDFVHKEGKLNVFNRWESRCRNCGMSYITSSMGFAATTLTRTCPDHRGADVPEGILEWRGDPVTWKQLRARNERREGVRADEVGLEKRIDEELERMKVAQFEKWTAEKKYTLKAMEASWEMNADTKRDRVRQRLMAEPEAADLV